MPIFSFSWNQTCKQVVGSLEMLKNHGVKLHFFEMESYKQGAHSQEVK